MLTNLVERFPLLQGMLDFVFPPLCAGCRVYSESPDGLCQKCLDAIDWFDSPTYLYPERADLAAGGADVDSEIVAFPVYAAGNYTGPLREVVLNLKFHGVFKPAGLMARRVAETFGAKLSEFGATALVPVPLHPGREYGRGYNQAAIFTSRLSEALGLPVHDDLLVRTAKRRPQSRLNELERAANIRGVFEVVEREGDERPTLFLVDDVVTSGATILEARRTLVAAGYPVAAAIAIARAL